jgi:hypothetical protein
LVVMEKFYEIQGCPGTTRKKADTPYMYRPYRAVFPRAKLPKRL